jgi:D-inositol-3-phosphate glycosyltransferase
MELVPNMAEEIAAPYARCKIAAPLEVALLTGGIDRPYAFGLAMALAAHNIHIDVIGSATVDSPEMHRTTNVTFLNLWPLKQRKPCPIGSLYGLLRHYLSLLRYATKASPRLFHILWNSKIQFFDRTLLMLYYKALGKRLALTAHNVNQAKRDSRDTWLNRATLTIQYHLCDHIFVHTQKMKNELLSDFRVKSNAVTVIRHPINNAFPETGLTSSQAKTRLGLGDSDKAILFLGRIKPYKGIEYLLPAFHTLAAEDRHYRLIIAGEVQRGNEAYLESLLNTMALELERKQVLLRPHFIPDEDMELYLKGADVLVLPYKEIFQSGVLFLAYSFGLPVIATDVGSFRDEIVAGVTGYICRPADTSDLAATIGAYFRSDLYRRLDIHRDRIREYAKTQHSWDAVADVTRNVYARLLRTL